MRLQRPWLRIAIRFKTREAQAKGNRKLVRILRWALHDDLLDAVLSALEERYGVLAIGDGDFLRFILENWEEILEIILTIIELIGGLEHATDDEHTMATYATDLLAA